MKKALNAANVARDKKIQDLTSNLSEAYKRDPGSAETIEANFNRAYGEVERQYEEILSYHRNSRVGKAQLEKWNIQLDVADTFADELQALLKQPEDTLTDNLPMLQDWFPMHMKMSLNDAAVDKRIDAVRFPINEYALQKQTGMNPDTDPARMEEFSIWATPDIAETDTFDYIPEETAQRRGRQYAQKTNEAIKRIEAEYGIKLNVKEITDDNRNKFLEVDMTPEIREAFQTVLMSRGGAVADRVAELLDESFRK